MWTWIETNVSREHTASIFKAQDGGTRAQKSNIDKLSPWETSDFVQWKLNISLFAYLQITVVTTLLFKAGRIHGMW